MKTLILVLLLLFGMAGCTTITPEGKVLRSPGGNALASLFFPGSGQWCNGEVGRGWAYFAPAMAMNIAYLASAEHHQVIEYIGGHPSRIVNWTTYNETYLYIGLGIGLISAIDAYNSSKKFNLGIVSTGDGMTAALTWRF